MNGAGRGSGWDNAAADQPVAEVDAEPGVDAILADDALLDALGRGELPAHYRADLTARLITSWREDLDEPESIDSPTLALTPVTLPGLQLSRLPLLNAPDRTDATESIPRHEELPPYDGSDDRIEEPFRKAFVAAGYARPTEEAPTQQLSAALAALEDDVPADKPVRRHVRRRRLDRVVVAAAAAAAVIAAGSAGSVAAASTAQPGDTLWPISRVIYADRAHSIEAGQEAHTAIAQAKQAAARGDTAEARRLLAKAKQKAAEVRKGSDEEDALHDDMATIAALTDSLGPSPDGTDDDGGDPSTAGPSAQPQPNHSPRRRGRNPTGQTSSSGGTIPAPPPTTDSQPTKGAPPVEAPPTSDAPTTEPTTDAPTTEPPTTDPPAESTGAAAQEQLTTAETAAAE